jgi:hypothetical protein
MLILRSRCNDTRVLARGKESTVSVDNFAEKISAWLKKRCFLGSNQICLFFRQLFKPLINNKRFSDFVQITEKTGQFVKEL